MNRELSRASLGGIAEPAATLLIYERDAAGTTTFPHEEKAVVGYVDGYAEVTSPGCPAGLTRSTRGEQRCPSRDTRGSHEPC